MMLAVRGRCSTTPAMHRIEQTKSRRRGRCARLALLLLLLCVPPGLTSCHVTTFSVGMGSNCVHQETMQQYYLFFGLIRLNEVDIQRVVGDLTSYDVEVGFSYHDGVWTWASLGDFAVSLVLLPFTVTRQAVTVKY